VISLAFSLLVVCKGLSLENTVKSSPIPILFWSGSDYLSGHNKEHLSTVQPPTIEKTLHALLGFADQDTGILNSRVNTSPELVVLFLEPKITTPLMEQSAGSYGLHDGGAFSNLKRYVETSISSLVAPYGSYEGYWRPFLLLLSHVVQPLEDHKASFILATPSESELSSLKGTISKIGLDGLEEYLSSHKELFSNEVADLLVVEFPQHASLVSEEFASDDALLAKITGQIAALSSGNYVALFTGMNPVFSDAYVHLTTETPQNDIEHYLRDVLQSSASSSSNCTTNCTNDTFWPTPLVEGLMVSLVLLIILTIGLYCSLSMQGPDRFEAPVQRVRGPGGLGAGKAPAAHQAH